MSDMRVKSQQLMQAFQARDIRQQAPQLAEQPKVQVQARALDQFVADSGSRSRLSHLLDGGGSRSTMVSAAFQQQQQQGDPVVPPRWDTAAGQAFLHTGETWSEVPTQDERLGVVTRQDNSIYNQDPATVLSNADANWCATFAWDFFGAAVPGWSTQSTRDGAATQYETTSSTTVWNQVAGQEIPAGGLPVSLPVGAGGESLNFTALESTTSADGQQTLDTLGDIPVGESRAVVMRPLDEHGNADDKTGHWVVVERVSEDEYRIHQSAPGNWVLAGTAWAEGGTFTQTFTGADAAQQVSDYIHMQSQFASTTQQGSPGYGLVVLEPAMPSTPAPRAGFTPEPE
jgi:hypothetical protein